MKIFGLGPFVFGGGGSDDVGCCYQPKELDSIWMITLVINTWLAVVICWGWVKGWEG